TRLVAVKEWQIARGGEHEDKPNAADHPDIDQDLPPRPSRDGRCDDRRGCGRCRPAHPGLTVRSTAGLVVPVPGSAPIGLYARLNMHSTRLPSRRRSMGMTPCSFTTPLSSTVMPVTSLSLPSRATVRMAGIRKFP